MLVNNLVTGLSPGIVQLGSNVNIVIDGAITTDSEDGDKLYITTDTDDGQQNLLIINQEDR